MFVHPPARHHGFRLVELRNGTPTSGELESAGRHTGLARDKCRRPVQGRVRRTSIGSAYVSGPMLVRILQPMASLGGSRQHSADACPPVRRSVGRCLATAATKTDGRSWANCLSRRFRFRLEIPDWFSHPYGSVLRPDARRSGPRISGGISRKEFRGAPDPASKFATGSPTVFGSVLRACSLILA